jgi:gamma-glutamyltranspeptidase/glutathione hydrolase
VFACPQQAETLEKIAASHGESFYRGELAQKMAAHALATGGMLTESDLADHRSEWVAPIRVDFGGVQVYELPPNGQGLAALIALGLLRHLEVGRYATDSADSLHLQIESMKIGFAETFRHVADPDHLAIDPQTLLDEAVLAKKAAAIRMDRSLSWQTDLPLNGGTVYLTAADADGMMVSYIQSNYMGFGSGIVVPGTGISFQNRGIGFSLDAGHPNRVAGGKRPFHTIIPGFVGRHGQALMSFGVMGAHMQPQGHVQMMVRIVAYGQNPQAACDAPRWFVSRDGQVALEPGFGPGVAEELVQRGHALIKDPDPGIFGGAQLIAKLPDGYCAASDPRKDGQAVGF